MAKCVAIVSGGMDSMTMVKLLQYEEHEVNMISFNYGQRHVKELDFAQLYAIDNSLRHEIINLQVLTDLISDSVLTDHDREVPDGLYNEETMKLTVVPNRNMIMLSIATGWAVTLGAEFVAAGIHAGDHFIYPDCRPVFAHSMNQTMKYATEGFSSFPERGPGPGSTEVWRGNALFTPFLNMGKHDIARLGDKLGVDYRMTWSCYKAGEIHCGRCGTCTERKEAFRLAKVPDPTQYEDEEFKVLVYRG